MQEIKDYDGIFFTPDPDPDADDGNIKLSFFHFNDEYANKQSIESTEIGHKYYVAFFQRDKEGEIQFDGSFEAIFADPQVYIKRLAGAKVYGCIVRKTENSGKWFDDYLTKALKKLKIQKLTEYCKAIANAEVKRI